MLFYDLFVSSLLEGVEATVGRTDGAGGEMYYSRHMLKMTSSSLPPSCTPLSFLFFYKCVSLLLGAIV